MRVIFCKRAIMLELVIHCWKRSTGNWPYSQQHVRRGRDPALGHDEVVEGGDIIDGHVAKNEVTRALTEDGDDHAVLQHLHGAVEEVEDVLERVALVDEELVGRAEVGLHGGE